MRRKFIVVNGEVVEKGSQTEPSVNIPLFMPDIKPYQSMITGETISSRSTHRQHLKDHGMVEVGNDSSLTKPYQGMPDTNPQQRKEILRHEVNKWTDKEWKAEGKRELERLRYNTRGIPER